MCGLIALSLTSPDDQAPRLLQSMLAAQAHRGPDHTGHEILDGGRALLGHNRLSIIDLSPRGHQPLSNEDGTVWVIANGELYNFRDLRRDLEGRGHVFRSDSDSEVIVHLYEEYGTELLPRLEGMFAFVLWDARERRMFIARDRVGKKPLAYAESAAGVAVASEIPPLRLMPGLPAEVDREALGLFMLRNFRHVPDPYTLWRGIRRLPPGHAATIRDGRLERQWRWWRPRFETRPVSAEAVLDAFDAAVTRRLVADVEIGAMLSGGVDSTAIVQVMTRHMGEGVRTYALGRDDQDEEILRADRAARMLNTRHRAFHFDPERHYDVFLDLQRIHGEPIALLPLVHAYELFRAMRDDGLKVAMAGHGADETFYGYTGFLDLARLSRVLDAAGPLARLGGPLAAILPGRLGQAATIAGAPPGRRKAALYAAEARDGGLVAGQARTLEDAVGTLFGTWFTDGAPRSYVDEAAIIGLMHENAHSVTIAGDLPAMACGIETRAPFLDHHMIELAWSIAYRDKVSAGKEGGGLKRILKRALADRLPHDLLYAPKRGFGHGIQERDVLSGPWRTVVEATLDRMGDAGGLLDGDAVTAVRQRFATAPDGESAAAIAKLFVLGVALEGERFGEHSRQLTRR